MIELPGSTFYCHATAAHGLADAQLVELIQTIQDELPGYGYRSPNEFELQLAQEAA